jgi:hypothetical protein
VGRQVTESPETSRCAGSSAAGGRLHEAKRLDSLQCCSTFGVDQRLSSRLARAWNSAIALLVAAAILVQLWIAVRVSATPPGHAVGTLAGTPIANRVLRVLSFFTIQSNILSGATSAQLARNPARDGRVWRAVRLAALFGITVTGIVYTTVLAKVHEPRGWQETATNSVFHYVVPIMMVLGWLLFGPRPRIEPRTITLAILWPVAWAGYALIYGAITKWYPYPFVDVITHGYGRVMVNAVAVVVVLLVVTRLFWLADRRLPVSEGATYVPANPKGPDDDARR